MANHYDDRDRNGDEVRVIDQHLSTYAIDGDAVSVHLGQIADPVGLAREILAAAGRHDVRVVEEATPPSDEVEALSTRVATLERAMQLAVTTGELRNVEDHADDRARRAEQRLAVLEHRMLAVERQHTSEAETVRAVRRWARKGVTDE